MIDTSNISSIFGAKVVDPDGAKVGTVKQVYVDKDNGQPNFVTVATGLFGSSETFVPLQGSDLDGDELRVGYDKDMIKDAPRVDADGDISDEENDTIWDYYEGRGGRATDGAGSSGAGRDADRTGGSTDGSALGNADAGTAAHRAGTGSDGAEDGDADDAMTRSEERLSVGKERVPTGRARLRKHVVTEQRNITVPVQREEVTLEREPITDGNVDEAMSGPQLTESEHEVTLNEEQVVVDKETVPVERVRLDKDTVTEQQSVSEDVAHEEVDLEQDDADHRR
ncbi:PRC and DUF2382 domain-containing protein [Microbacterium sp.]|uniref:PRC and DUF2382 domain-containing protein n=1 Tax=Microbacterium sp. TaxID=51671 RepID=UPI002810E36D|nr:PRC and DUF2382 domain-containing protein [Microbacterium sp.]